jgi:hypothetical protein
MSRAPEIRSQKNAEDRNSKIENRSSRKWTGDAHNTPAKVGFWIPVFAALTVGWAIFGFLLSRFDSAF